MFKKVLFLCALLLLLVAASVQAVSVREITDDDVLASQPDIKVIFFYDSLDTNSLMALASLREFKANYMVYSVDIRSPNNAWIVDALGATVVPSLRMVSYSPQFKVLPIDGIRFDSDSLSRIFN